MTRTSGNFQNFLGGEEQTDKLTYNSMADALWVPSQEIDTQSQTKSLQEQGIPDNLDTTSKLHLVGEKLKNLTGRLESAEKHNDPSGKGIRDVLDDKGLQPDKSSIKVQKVSRADLEKVLGEGNVGKTDFGVKTIHSAEELERLQKQVATVSKYADVQLSMIKGKNGEDIAIVSGIKAEEFATLINAENQKAQLGAAQTSLQTELKREMAVTPKQENVALDMSKLQKFIESSAMTKPKEPDMHPKEVSQAQNFSPLAIAPNLKQPDNGKGGIGA